MTHFNANPDRWVTGKVSARERRQLFTVWVGDAIDALMQRRDIISITNTIHFNTLVRKSNDHNPSFSRDWGWD